MLVYYWDDAIDGGTRINPLTLKYNLNFHPLEVVSRYRDPQLQMGVN